MDCDYFGWSFVRVLGFWWHFDCLYLFEIRSRDHGPFLKAIYLWGLCIEALELSCA